MILLIIGRDERGRGGRLVLEVGDPPFAGKLETTHFGGPGVSHAMKYLVPSILPTEFKPSSMIRTTHITGTLLLGTIIKSLKTKRVYSFKHAHPMLSQYSPQEPNRVTIHDAL